MIILIMDSSYKPEVYSNYKLYLGFCISLMFYNICFAIFFLGKLFISQTNLISKNVTFYEDFKQKLKNYPINPFSKFTCWGNFKSILCKKVPKSSLLLYNQITVNNINRTKDDINIMETELIQGMLMKTPNSNKNMISKTNSNNIN